MRTPRQWFRDRFKVNPPKREDWPEWCRDDWDWLYGNGKPVPVRKVSAGSYIEQRYNTATARYEERRDGEWVVCAGQPIPSVYDIPTTLPRQNGMKVRMKSGVVMVWLEDRWWNEIEYEREAKRFQMLAESDLSRTRSYAAATKMNKRCQNKDSVANNRPIQRAMQAGTHPVQPQSWHAQEDTAWWKEHSG